MRRKDREITDFPKIQAIIAKCDCIHIGMCKDNIPYVCTMNFGVSYEEQVCFYLHCASSGQKIDILKQQPTISFVLNCEHHFVGHADAKRATMEYSSVAGMAKVEFVEDQLEKIKALNSITDQYSQVPGNYDEAALRQVTILKCCVSEISGKQHKKER